MATYTEEDLARLRAAVAHGEQSVTHGNDSATYRSVAELLIALDRAENARARAAGRSSIVYPRLTDGFR